MWIHVYPNWNIRFNNEKLFLWNQSINVIYPNKKNEFMVPHHEKKGDYYVNLYLSQFIDEFWLKKC